MFEYIGKYDGVELVVVQLSTQDNLGRISNKDLVDSAGIFLPLQEDTFLTRKRGQFRRTKGFVVKRTFVRAVPLPVGSSRGARPGVLRIPSSRRREQLRHALVGRGSVTVDSNRVVARRRHAAHISADAAMDAAVHAVDLILKGDECAGGHRCLSTRRQVIEGGGIDVRAAIRLASSRTRV